MEQSDILEAGGFYFIHRFDSGNLGHVERVPSELISPSANYKTNSLETPDFEFNVWTRPDCYGTEFENGNRTWFYFGIQGGQTNSLVRLNIINLNKQGKMYSQGMAPVTRMLPGQPHWERIKDRPIHSTDDNTFTLSFKYRTPDNLKATTFFAFTYPFSFTDLQNSLTAIDQRLLPMSPMQSLDDIYYVRENVICTLEGRRTDLLTISSYHGITNEREEQLKNLFPDGEVRPFKFNKKVIFISARVHPGETPSSFVFNGLLNLLTNRTDPVAVQLRKLYVFKLIPFLNPDGVARGHYRTDTRGVNLNRVYLHPSLEHHPTVYAARVLIRYYHFRAELEDVPEEPKSEYRNFSRAVPNVDDKVPFVDSKKKSPLRPKENTKPTAALRRQNAAKSARSDAATSTSSLIAQVSRASSTGDLTAQVCDLKLKETREQPSQTILSMEARDQLERTVADECALEKSTAAQVPDTLRHLRDSLKNNIGLRMGGSAFQSSASDVLSVGNSLLGWCRDCKDTTDLHEKSSDDPSLVNSPDSPKLLTEDIKAQSAYFTNPKEAVLIQSIPEVLLPESTSATSSCDHSDMTPATSEQSSVDRPTTIIAIENKPKSAPKPRKRTPVRSARTDQSGPKEPDSGLFLYVDMHGHASKKGIFMYGNHFYDQDSAVECMLLPGLMSLNNAHFHFSSCNFTERNMYLKDRRDGMSREGSGRVAVLKATGLIRSYTLECNYNTGRLVNVLPPAARDAPPPPPPAAPPNPPKYTPHIFEEVGRALGASILDLTGHNPNSRVPASEHRTLASVRDWLRTHSNNRSSQFTLSRLRPTKSTSPTRAPLYARSPKSKMADVERKENTYIGAKSEDSKKSAFKKPEKAFGKARSLAESEPKPKSLSAKKRNILAIRKPNAVRSRSATTGKAKAGMSEAGPAPRPKATFSRFRRAKPSSSSEEIASTGRDEPSGSAAKRRPFPPPPAAPRLKKIRLKTNP